MAIKKVVVVEDDKMLSTLSAMFLKDLGYELVGSFQTGQSAVEACKASNPDIVLMDIHLDGSLDGIESAEIIQMDLDIPIIYLTSDSNEDTIQRMVKANSYGFLLKPVDKKTLEFALDFAIKKHARDRITASVDEQCRILIDASPDSIVVITDNTVMFVNRAALKTFGAKDFNELIGKKISDLFDAKFRDEFLKKEEEALGETGTIDPYPSRIQSLEGEKTDVTIIGSVLMFKSEKSLQIVIRENT